MAIIPLEGLPVYWIDVNPDTGGLYGALRLQRIYC
jgi:hypothetical protein